MRAAELPARRLRSGPLPELPRRRSWSSPASSTAGGAARRSSARSTFAGDRKGRLSVAADSWSSRSRQSWPPCERVRQMRFSGSQRAELWRGAQDRARGSRVGGRPPAVLAATAPSCPRCGGPLLYVLTLEGDVLGAAVARGRALSLLTCREYECRMQCHALVQPSGLGPRRSSFAPGRPEGTGMLPRPCSLRFHVRKSTSR